MGLKYNLSVIVIIALVYNSNDSVSTPQGNLITRWANQLGKELRDLGKIITKSDDIENNYVNAALETKDPRQIISEIVGNISVMMRKKMDAVYCIIHAAETAAELFNTSNADHDYYYYRSNTPEPGTEQSEKDEDIDMYLKMELDNDTHFFNLRVNTTHSAVHVPTNIYQKHDNPEIAIRWSEELDKIFTQNYKADPALSWQYFGSSSGIMRHYPAMEWGNLDLGLFDCRIRTWFIEAATCTKDVVILLDNSGSMKGWNSHIALLTIRTILQTLSNNDYVNILTFNESIEYLVECFEDELVQATKENIGVLMDRLPLLSPENKSVIDDALVKAFGLLYKYRDQRGCSEHTDYCNQAIMLITDDVPTNFSDTITTYNRLNNGTSIPIRIFTYLVGSEPSSIDYSLWMACSNRGYHTHVNALEQVSAAVYKYILVLARPLVLQREQHPLSWTHAYYDETYDLGNKSSSRFEKFRLLTSVAGPAFNLTAYNNPVKKTAELLGVAGTDVPIDDISKLMYHYKTGVNSHSFIVSNNGYVLKHPSLKPLYFDKLKGENKLTENYNSIDLTEVEQLDDDSGPREPQYHLQKLRTALVNGEQGVEHDVPIKYYYDDMRRVSREINDYYYAPIPDTPFSIGFAIPDLYGNYSIEVGDEIEKHRFSPINISTFFSGSNWEIHPSWVYCKYHYLEGHEFDTPEDELIHFVNRMNTKNFKWSTQYEVETEHKDDETVSCGAKTLGDEDYYCDRNLVQRVVFDAKHTKSAFADAWTARNSEENNLKTIYAATLRFVATMSGFTRWEYISNYTRNDTATFGDLHSRAIDETWYKSAVIQHRYNNNSFVYSVPFATEKDEFVLVTGSFAIFPSRDNVEAPGAVVGFQFSHSNLKDRFYDITMSSHMCRGCLTCESGLECYVIDSSGYTVISENDDNIGKFFGDIEGVTMETMIQYNIFEKVTIRNYQAMCDYFQWVKGDSNTLVQPFQYIKWTINWTLTHFIWLLFKMNIYQLWDPNWTFANDDKIQMEEVTATMPPKLCKKNCNEAEERFHRKNKIPVFERRYTACEKEHDLYSLRQEVFVDQGFKELLQGEIKLENCTRPFYLRMIPHSNLLLVAIIESYGPENCFFVHTTQAREISYAQNTVFPCQKLYLNNFTRRRLVGCFNEHHMEQEIIDCGISSRIQLCVNLFILSIVLCIMQIFN